MLRAEKAVSWTCLGYFHRQSFKISLLFFLFFSLIFISLFLALVLLSMVSALRLACHIISRPVFISDVVCADVLERELRMMLLKRLSLALELGI